MKELIKKFLLKVGLRKEDDPLSAIRTEANAEAQGENKEESDEREKTSPKEPPEVVAHRFQAAQVYLSFGHSPAHLVLRL